MIPPCMTEYGCEIEDAVTDPGMVELVDRFIRAVHLRNLTGYDGAQRRDLEDTGLLDDPETLYQLEQIIFDHAQKQRAKE